MPVMIHYESVDAYMAAQPGDVQPKLKQLRDTIRKAAPQAEESISYGMPAYKFLGKPLVYFGAAKKHIGLYALPTTNEVFKKELTAYDVAKGTIRLPPDKPLPVKLITAIVKFRMEEIREAIARKQSAKKAKPVAKNSKKA